MVVLETQGPRGSSGSASDAAAAWKQVRPLRALVEEQLAAVDNGPLDRNQDLARSPIDSHVTWRA